MMVFSALLKPSTQTTPRRGSRPSHHSASTHSPEQSSQETSPSSDSHDQQYIREESHLSIITSEDPDLRDLNNSLVALAAIFPDVQVEVFREMLSSFEEESRLAVVTEALLKHKMKWVRGRYRVTGKGKAQLQSTTPVEPTNHNVVPEEEKFRSAEYKRTVKSVTYREFKGLSRSTINAVLAEFNHSYTLARPTLVALSSKSWRFSLSSFILRRKPTSSEAENHPLVVWQSTGRGSIVPTIISTGSPELDRELFDTLIVPIQKRIYIEREDKDHALALELNNHEAEKSDALHDCECCFTSLAFEELTACDEGGHLLCFQCVRHAINEATFGQGWQRNIDLDTGSLRCLAAMSGDCRGCVSQDLVHRAFAEDRGGKDIVRKFDERLAEENLLRTKLQLVRCPFCNYAEVDELYLPVSQRSWRLKRIGPSSLYTLMILILGVGMIPFILPVFLLFSFLFLLTSSQQTVGNFAAGHFHASVTRLRRKRLGLKFTCQNQLCRRSSCISCSKAWTDIHICHESSLLALRTQVELAMSLAIKRTCPRCNTSFVKSSGCNKLTCVCGYQMCYVCRKDIGNGEGYRHFCEHFRPNGGRSCTECSKCDLYRCEDDEVVVKKAKEEAERQWIEKEETADGGDEKIRKVLEEKWKKGHGSVLEGIWRYWKAPDWVQILDALVEGIVE